MASSFLNGAADCCQTKRKTARQTCTFCLFFLLSSFCITDHTLNNTGHYLLFQLLMLCSISLALPHGFALVSCVHRTGICFIMIQKRPCIFNAHYQMCCTFPLPLLLPPPYGLCLVFHLTVSPVRASVQRFALLRFANRTDRMRLRLQHLLFLQETLNSG